jgi:hypothetical protein
MNTGVPAAGALPTGGPVAFPGVGEEKALKLSRIVE